MKRFLIGLAMCAASIGAMAQKAESKEIIKDGWNFGPLPVVGFDSDLGFQYGVCLDIFNFGDGSRYPSYDYKMNLEASTFTGGSSLLRFYGDFKTLIPDGKLFVDCTYFTAKKYDFYGYNGYASPFFVDGIGLPEGETSALNMMSRNQFRFVASMQQKLAGNLYWTIGLGYYNIKKGGVKLDEY